MYIVEINGASPITAVAIIIQCTYIYQKSAVRVPLQQWESSFSTCIHVLWWDFFIPVSSLKVFVHSIHSERRRIYLGDQYKLFRMTPYHIDDYSVSGSFSQQCSGIILKLLRLFSSQKHFCQVPNQYRSLMTFRNKIQNKTFTWPNMSFYAR